MLSAASEDCGLFIPSSSVIVIVVITVAPSHYRLHMVELCKNGKYLPLLSCEKLLLFGVKMRAIKASYMQTVGTPFRYRSINPINCRPVAVL